MAAVRDSHCRPRMPDYMLVLNTLLRPRMPDYMLALNTLLRPRMPDYMLVLNTLLCRRQRSCLMNKTDMSPHALPIHQAS